MMEHEWSVQNSTIDPYSRLIWLKKSTVLTASHSLRSSPGGSMTACCKLPASVFLVRTPSSPWPEGTLVLRVVPPLSLPPVLPAKAGLSQQAPPRDRTRQGGEGKKRSHYDNRVMAPSGGVATKTRAARVPRPTTENGRDEQVQTRPSRQPRARSQAADHAHLRAMCAAIPKARAARMLRLRARGRAPFFFQRRRPRAQRDLQRCGTRKEDITYKRRRMVESAASALRYVGQFGALEERKTVSKRCRTTASATASCTSNSQQPLHTNSKRQLLAAGRANATRWRIGANGLARGEALIAERLVGVARR